MSRCEFCEGLVDPIAHTCTSCGAAQSTESPQPAPAATEQPAATPTTRPAVAQTGAVKTRKAIPFILIYYCTLGIYALYLLGSTWPEQYNQLLGEKRYNQTKITLLYIVTCGIALFYFAWKFITDLDEIANRLGLPKNPGASIIRIGFIGWFIPYANLILTPWHLWQIQKELNRIAEVHNAGQNA